MTGTAHEPPPAGEEPYPGEEDRLGEAALGTFRAARRLAADTGVLAALEARLAATSAVRMLVCGVGAAACAVTAWFLALAALFVLLTRLDWPADLVLGLLALLNALAGWALIAYAGRLSGHLTFRRTRGLLLQETGDEGASAGRPGA